MNAGYFFIICAWLAVVLITTHWFDFLFKQQDIIPQARRTATVIILLLLSLQGLYIPLTANVSISAGSFLFLVFLFLYCYWKYTTQHSLPIISIVIFLGIFHAVAYELFYLDPILMIFPPQILLPCLLALFVLITLYELPFQLLAITGGYLLGEAVHKLFIYKHVQPVYIGDALFRDQLAMAILVIIFTKLLIRLCLKIYIHIKQYTFRLLNRGETSEETDSLRTR